MTKHPFTNELIHETSPYLLQHAHNPVDWMPWNEQTLQKAKNENKLLIISIGYSACHWCHVMEHESFEDTTVAKLMNEHFVSIKVDREERPDVDQIYMDAAQLLTGGGGWPLNAIALPDGRPIYAGTYFPNEKWKQVLHYFADYWQNKRGEALQRAEQITQGIKGMDGFALDSNTPAIFSPNDRSMIFDRLDAGMDYDLGGRKGAPKFPMPITYQYLLQNYYYTGNPKALKAVTATLDGMMNGGIYDQLGGGFARYSVDERWEIPHFEKMLYDNAQLVSLYAEAYRLTKNERYKEVVYETLDFVERELSDSSGGFYSALDADSEGEEGKFYVWSYEELKQILGIDFEDFKKVFRISPGGNFEGRKNNLVRIENSELKPEIVAQNLKKWKEKLLKERGKRIRPALDDKILTSWNALMLMGYTNAYESFSDQKFLDRALVLASFLRDKMLQPDGSIRRNYKNGKTSINGFLDDYSFTIQAFIALYEVTFDEQWLLLANEMSEYVIQHFYNIQTGLFFYTSISDAPLIARKTETSDNVIPASNSSMANALYRLGLIDDREDYIQKAEKAISKVKDNMLTHPAYYANWAILMDYLMEEPFEVAIVGKDAKELKQTLQQHFLPHAVFLGSTSQSNLPLLKDKMKNDGTYIYVCRNKTCKLPVKTVEEALVQMKK
ncbi:MAG: thioredoxin domain-containing protein [Bacteroidetes bacterium]|nr:thioredoxin domain-containing protein [Bacteroidota bacterium]